MLAAWKDNWQQLPLNGNHLQRNLASATGQSQVTGQSECVLRGIHIKLNHIQQFLRKLCCNGECLDCVRLKPLASQTRKIVPFLTPTALAMLPPQHWVAMASDSNVGRLTLNITLDLLGIDRNSQTNEPRIISANKDFEVIRSVCDGIACRQRQLNVITKLSIRGIPQAYV